MQIKEAMAKTGLTKKAIAYYCELGLVHPAAAENGYREFSAAEIGTLQKIAVLRKLDIPTHEIKNILNDETGDVLRRISMRRALAQERHQIKQTLLRRLSTGADYDSLRPLLDALDKEATVAERLLSAFPSYFGRYICMHFAQFLRHPLTSKKQQLAYQRMLHFLDSVPDPELPADLQDFLITISQELDITTLHHFHRESQKALQDPRGYLADHREAIMRHSAWQQSEEYKRSPAYRLGVHMRTFMQASGYNDVFLPAMKAISPSYAAYAAQLMHASEVFADWLPEYRKDTQ